MNMNLELLMKHVERGTIVELIKNKIPQLTENIIDNSICFHGIDKDFVTFVESFGVDGYFEEGFFIDKTNNLIIMSDGQSIVSVEFIDKVTSETMALCKEGTIPDYPRYIDLNTFKFFEGHSLICDCGGHSFTVKEIVHTCTSHSVNGCIINWDDDEEIEELGETSRKLVCSHCKKEYDFKYITDMDGDDVIIIVEGLKNLPQCDDEE